MGTTTLAASCKLNIFLTYESAILLLGIYARQQQAYVYTNTHMFTAALFVLAQSLKQPKYPPAGECINKL